jgi:CRISPR/Cas system-associated endonuclease Cas3-HD
VIAMARKRWIQRAIKHKGALKRWLKKEHPELLKNGKIAWAKLRKFYEKNKDNLTEHRRRQIQLALTLHRLALKRRKK